MYVGANHAPVNISLRVVVLFIYKNLLDETSFVIKGDFSCLDAISCWSGTSFCSNMGP